MFIISLAPYFIDDNNNEYEFDNGDLPQYRLVLNVLRDAFNAPNLEYDEEFGVVIFTVENNNINVGNIVNNIRAEIGNIAIAGAEGRHLRLMFRVVQIVQRPNAQNVNNGKEGGRKRRRRSNKKNKKHRTYRKKTNKRRKRSTRK